MRPEAIILSPVDYPLVWVAFLLKWGASGACVFFGVRIWRTTTERWWLLLSAAFLLPIVSYVVQCGLLGLPPLPLGYQGAERFVESSTEPAATFSRTVMVSLEWDVTAPLVALALWWAHRSQRSNPERTPPANAG